MTASERDAFELELDEFMIPANLRYNVGMVSNNHGDLQDETLQKSCSKKSRSIIWIWKRQTAHSIRSEKEPLCIVLYVQTKKSLEGK